MESERSTIQMIKGMISLSAQGTTKSMDNDVYTYKVNKPFT